MKNGGFAPTGGFLGDWEGKSAKLRTGPTNIYEMLGVGTQISPEQSWDTDGYKDG